VHEELVTSFDGKDVELILNHALRVNPDNGEASTVEHVLMEERAAVQQRCPFVPTTAEVRMLGWYLQRLLQHVTMIKDVHP
jgi:hypothetical protein